MTIGDTNTSDKFSNGSFGRGGVACDRWRC